MKMMLIQIEAVYILSMNDFSMEIGLYLNIWRADSVSAVCMLNTSHKRQLVLLREHLFTDLNQTWLKLSTYPKGLTGEEPCFILYSKKS